MTNDFLALSPGTCRLVVARLICPFLMSMIYSISINGAACASGHRVSWVDTTGGAIGIPILFQTHAVGYVGNKILSYDVSASSMRMTSSVVVKAAPRDMALRDGSIALAAGRSIIVASLNVDGNMYNVRVLDIDGFVSSVAIGDGYLVAAGSRLFRVQINNDNLSLSCTISRSDIKDVVYANAQFVALTEDRIISFITLDNETGSCLIGRDEYLIRGNGLDAHGDIALVHSSDQISIFDVGEHIGLRNSCQISNLDGLIAAGLVGDGRVTLLYGQTTIATGTCDGEFSPKEVMTLDGVPLGFSEDSDRAIVATRGYDARPPKWHVIDNGAENTAVSLPWNVRHMELDRSTVWWVSDTGNANWVQLGVSEWPESGQVTQPIPLASPQDIRRVQALTASGGRAIVISARGGISTPPDRLSVDVIDSVDGVWRVRSMPVVDYRTTGNTAMVCGGRFIVIIDRVGIYEVATGENLEMRRITSIGAFKTAACNSSEIVLGLGKDGMRVFSVGGDELSSLSVEDTGSLAMSDDMVVSCGALGVNAYRLTPSQTLEFMGSFKGIVSCRDIQIEDDVIYMLNEYGQPVALSMSHNDGSTGTITPISDRCCFDDLTMSGMRLIGTRSDGEAWFGLLTQIDARVFLPSLQVRGTKD